MKLNKWILLLVAIMAILVFSGCSDEEASTEPAILSSDSILANLVVTPVNVTSFNIGSTYYPISVANLITSVGLTPTTNEGHQSLTINGVAATSGVESTVSVPVGVTNIDIVVTAENSSRTVYRVAVNRSAFGASSDSTLANLVTLPTNISSFSAATNYYEITVENSVASIGIIPTTNEAHQTVSIDGVEGTSGVKSTVLVDVGTNDIDIVVTAEDASTNSYTVRVVRAVVGPSTDSSLANLVVSPTNIASYLAGTTFYSVIVANEVGSVDITATTNDGYQSLTINGIIATNGLVSSVTVAVGTNSIDIVVTAENSSTTTYTVEVVRAVVGPSTDSSLANLVVSPTNITSFSAGSTYYPLTVDNLVSSIDITATTNDGYQSLTINGVVATSGLVSSVAVEVGVTNIEIVVIAEDSSTTTNIVAVSRLSAIIDSITNLLITEWADAGTDIDYIEIRNFGSNFVEIGTDFEIHLANDSTIITLINYGAGNSWSNYQPISGTVVIAPGEVFLVVEGDIFSRSGQYINNEAINTFLDSGMTTSTKLFLSTQATLIDADERLDDGQSWLAVGATTWSYTPDSVAFGLNVGTSTYSVLLNSFNFGVDSVTNTDMWINGNSAQRSTGTF